MSCDKRQLGKDEIFTDDDTIELQVVTVILAATLFLEISDFREKKEVLVYTELRILILY